MGGGGGGDGGGCDNALPTHHNALQCTSMHCDNAFYNYLLWSFFMADMFWLKIEFEAENKSVFSIGLARVIGMGVCS